MMMNSEEIKQKFLKEYPDATVEVVDLTGAGSHYKMTISCQKLQILPRITAHRQIMGLFDSQLKSGQIHALTIDFKK